MDLSTLKLVIEKGPKEGEALEYKSKPGFTIRIGRVARGNTFAIKDNGISTKHLSIECCGQDKWVLKDLDSSNGTVLNSSLLPPLTGHDLRDGDVLKIGEVTSIRVRISQITDSQAVGRNLRSGARVLRTGNSEGVQVVSDVANPRGRGRGRGRGDVNLEEDKVEISENVEGIREKGVLVSKRRTRNSKNEEDKDVDTEISLRRTTRSRAVKNKDNSALEKIPEVVQNAAPIEKRNTRATRGRKKKEVETETAQSVTEEHNEEEEQLASELITEQEIRNETEIGVVKPEPQSNVYGIVSKEKESMSEIAQKDGNLACQLNFEHEKGDETRDPDTGLVDKDEEVEIALDLSKMKLGEWLDHLERFLPKQIRAETDQIIQDMQKRSQQFHEFILQQQKDKGKLPLG